MYSVLLFLTVLLLFFTVFGFTLKEAKPIPLFKTLKDKIKAKVNYSDGPNQADFFTDTELNKYSEIGQYKDLEGVWTGTYDLVKESIFWINPKLSKSNIFKLIDFKPYAIFLKLDNTDKRGSLKLLVSQEDISYSSVNIEVANNKQINYWTKAMSLNWLEIVRGKILRLNNNELFTIFQTTVYEEKIPIYAFRGEVVLRKK